MKRSAFLLLLLPLTACVTTDTLKAQQEETATEKKRADDLQKEFDTFKSSSAAEMADLNARLKVTGDQLASAQLSNKDLEAAKAAEVEKLKKSYEDMTAGLKSEISAGEIKITQLQGKLTVNLVDRILFDSGKAQVKEDGRKVLDKVGAVLNRVADKNIRIEGHTDNVPITTELRSKYPSNWELSTARATAVARYLQDHDKVDPARLVAAGYGEYHPVSPNNTPEGRALNRRIEIVLVPKE